MAKFINRKEQVIDLKLTGYGNYLFSIGKFEPIYYSFLDDNIIYDGAYTGLNEKQNDVVSRIRNDSQYIESLVMFQDAENQFNTLNTENENDEDNDYLVYFQTDIEPMRIEPRVDNYRFDAMIGDAYLEGDTQTAPAWKIVALEGTIVSSFQKDNKNQIRIPQININLNYVKQIEDFDPNVILTEEDFIEIVVTSDPFADNRVIKLVRENLLVYGEEVNTALLTENFEIEIFEVDADAYPKTWIDGSSRDALMRKYFPNENTSIQGELMKTIESEDGTLMAIQKDAEHATKNTQLTTNSVEYYFDILTDAEIDIKKACKIASEFNKDSYYVDLDFDCTSLRSTEPEDVDIYGKVTEPEICQ